MSRGTQRRARSPRARPFGRPKRRRRRGPGDCWDFWQVMEGKRLRGFLVTAGARTPKPIAFVVNRDAASFDVAQRIRADHSLAGKLLPEIVTDLRGRKPPRYPKTIVNRLFLPIDSARRVIKRDRCFAGGCYLREQGELVGFILLTHSGVEDFDWRIAIAEGRPADFVKSNRIDPAQKKSGDPNSSKNSPGSEASERHQTAA